MLRYVQFKVLHISSPILFSILVYLPSLRTDSILLPTISIIMLQEFLLSHIVFSHCGTRDCDWRARVSGLWHLYVIAK